MRTLSASLALALFALFASAAFARDVTPEPRLNFATSAPAPGPVTTTGVRADTLFLFAGSGAGAWGAPGTNARGFTFDNGAGGPATAGWAPDDYTDQPDAYWHLQDLYLSNGHATDFSAADDFADGGPTAGNDFAWWCGRSGPCGWTHPIGYGTDWEQWLVLSVPAAATAGALEFDYVADFEGGNFDYFTLYARTGTNEPVALMSNHVEAERAVRHYGPIAFGNVDDLIFAFHSDGAWSDEDGSFITDIGAVWLDNFEIDYEGAADIAWDFESGVEADFPALTASYPAGAGMYGDLYANLFSEDPCIANSTYAWAFFDLYTFNPDYPGPVIRYGPPYVDNGIVSPALERAHALGDPIGQPMDEAWGPNSQFLVRYMFYKDLPLEALIFHRLEVRAVVDDQPCLGEWTGETYYYGDDDQWMDWFVDYSLRLRNSAGGGNIVGALLDFRVVDMCGVWCNVYGEGYGHPMAPFFDMISAMVVNSSSIAWNVDTFRRFQDNFPEANGKVRIDSAIDVQPSNSTTLVIGDSTRVDLNMDGQGGIQPDLVSVPDQTRPSLYLHSRVVAGPHAGSTDPAMGDPDAGDGIWSPHIGTAAVHGVTWNVAIADTARYQGTAYAGVWAFDFADDYFEPGDIIEYYYKATSNLGTDSTRPLWAESADPALRSAYTVRCLPTAGATLLLVEDGGGPDPQRAPSLQSYWLEAFRYNGYGEFDIYTTQAPSAGLHNGLGGRAAIGDLDPYEMIVWDSGDLPSYTIQNALPDDIAFDDLLLDDWLTNSEHNTCLWVMGNEIASDLADEPSFLHQALGATRILNGTYYDDLTGVLVPTVYATHPALEIGGADPSFILDAGCPTIENLDLVVLNEANPLAVEAFAWAEAGGSQAKAGIYNQDPDGDGLATSPGGWTNRTLFNPFSYSEVWDAGFGVENGYDYARRLVGDVLTNLCGYESQGTPDDADPVPAHFALAGGYPNPFNPQTTLRFALAAPEQVHLVVYDLAGRRVRTLVDAPLPAAHHEAIWDGRDEGGHRVASGVYFVRLVAGDFRASEKLVLVK